MALADYEEPPLGPEEIRVRVEYASPKHGTELAVFRGRILSPPTSTTRTGASS